MVLPWYFVGSRYDLLLMFVNIVTYDTLASERGGIGFYFFYLFFIESRVGSCVGFTLY
jgi:hypothetical protein